MTKKAISVTLRPENLLWLRARTRASSRRSVSETLDDLISAARAAAGRSGPVKSVVGKIRIPASDAGLTRADRAIRRLFALSATARRPRWAVAASPRVRRA